MCLDNKIRFLNDAFMMSSQVEEQNTNDQAGDRGVCARALYDYQAGECC